MVKRIYVPLPDYDARKGLIRHLITKHFSSSLKTGEEEDMKKSSSGMSITQSSTTSLLLMIDREEYAINFDKHNITN
jgi:hypothetical protein